MKKITSIVAVILITALNWHSNAQTYVQENFNTGMPGTWTITDGGAATGDSWAAGQQGGVTIDGSDCAFVDSDAFGNGVDMIETLTTPSFNSSNATLVYLDFDQYFNWIGNDTAAIDVFDGTNWVRVLTQNGNDVGASGNPDQQHIDITAYKNANMRVRFYFDDGNVWAWYWLVDNVHIYGYSCSTITAPWLDDVEAHTPTTTLGLSNCWNATASGNYAWDISGTGTTPSANTGPLVAHSGTNYFFTEASVGNAGNVAELYTPDVDLSALTIPTLEFYYHMFGTAMGDLYIDVFDGTWTTVDSIMGAQQVTQGAPWIRKDVYLSAFSGVVQIRFRAIGAGTFQGDIAIDDITITEGPTCPEPSMLTATNIIGVSADLGWTENGTATSWEIEWGTSGFTQGNGTSVFTGSNPHNLTGLAPLTSYDFYVRAVCGVGDSSYWIGPLSFITPCGSMVTPWVDNVETHFPTTNLTTSNCWNATATGNYAWDISGNGTTPSVGTGPLAAKSGTNFFFTEASVGSAGDIAELYTPNVDISSLTVPSLEFYYHMFGIVMGDLYIDVFNGTWTTVDSIMGAQQATQGEAWKKRYVNLSAFSGVVQIRFRAIGSGTYQGDIAIDDITITEAPTCPEPSLLSAINVAGYSADLSWSENGTATTWEIEWGTSGFTLGTGTSVFTGSNPHNLTGLTPLTSYDYFVRAVCGVGDSSYWAGPYNFSTTIPCPAPSILNVTSITSTSADLGWTENGVATTWEIEWGTSGFSLGTGNQLFTGTNPHNLTGLSAGIVYDFYVRAVCGSGDSSLWIGPNVFNTLCAGVIAPWIDDVEAHTPTTLLSISNCWSVVDGGAYSWDISGTGTTPSTGTGSPTANSGTNFFYTEATNGVAGDVAELYSPSIDLNPLITPMLNFYYHMFGNDMGDLYIDVNDGSWNTVDSILGAQQILQTDPFLLKSINLSAFSGIIQIRFRAISAGTYEGDMCIDDIAVEAAIGVIDNSENVKMSIYPNPNNGVFTLKVATTSVNELVIKVTNLQGQVVFSKNNFDNVAYVQEQIDLSNNAKGLYFVNVTSEKGIITHKIVVQ
jgi:hypothetical protein